MPQLNGSTAAHFLRIYVALIFKNLIQILVKMDRHPHRPGSRKYFGILDRHFVRDGIGGSSREPLCSLQCVAMEVSRVVKPCLIVESDCLDDQRVPFPVSAWIPHP